MGIPQKLIRLVRTTMCQNKASVKIDNQIGTRFEFIKGINQDGGLSITPFILALRNAVEEIDQRGTIYTNSSQICAYADDVVIVTRSETRLRQVYREVEEKPPKMGLIMIEEKTKYMIVPATQKGRQTQNWNLGDKIFENVSSFRYIGNVINNEGSISECVKDRIQLGNRAYTANYHMLKSKSVKRSAKMELHKTLIRPVATYGSEAWTLTKSDENLLKIFERKIMRKICGTIQEGDAWRIRKSEELNRSINGEDIVKFINAQRIRWLGRIKRMELGTIPRRMMEGRLLIGRRRGRPHLRWIDDVAADLKITKIR